MTPQAGVAIIDGHHGVCRDGGTVEAGNDSIAPAGIPDPRVTLSRNDRDTTSARRKLQASDFTKCSPGHVYSQCDASRSPTRTRPIVFARTEELGGVFKTYDPLQSSRPTQHTRPDPRSFLTPLEADHSLPLHHKEPSPRRTYSAQTGGNRKVSPVAEFTGGFGLIGPVSTKPGAPGKTPTWNSVTVVNALMTPRCLQPPRSHRKCDVRRWSRSCASPRKYLRARAA